MPFEAESTDSWQTSYSCFSLLPSPRVLLLRSMGLLILWIFVFKSCWDNSIRVEYVRALSWFC